MIIIFSGCSGSGKNSVMEGVMKQLKNSHFLRKNTTRAKRTEADDLTYNFFSKEEFEKKIKNNEMLEYNYYSEQYYGVEKKTFYDALKSKNFYFCDVDVNGCENMKKAAMGKEGEIISIFLYAPYQLLHMRLKRRGENTDEDIKRRLERFEFENEQAKNYDYLINSFDTKYSVPQTLKIITNHFNVR